MKSKVYSEIHSIIENIDEELKSKIPLNFLELIDEKRNKYYVPEIDFRKPLYAQNLERNLWKNKKSMSTILNELS